MAAHDYELNGEHPGKPSVFSYEVGPDGPARTEQSAEWRSSAPAEVRIAAAEFETMIWRQRLERMRRRSRWLTRLMYVAVAANLGTTILNVLNL